MSVESSARPAGLKLGEIFSITSYVQETTTRSASDCLHRLSLDNNSSSLFGGYNVRLILPKSKTPTPEQHFELEYYRQHYNSARSSHSVQRMRGVFFEKAGKTQLVARVKFTGSALVWLWLAVGLTLASFWLLAYTRNEVMFLLIAMTGGFLLAAILVMALDRYRFVKLVRECISVQGRASRP